MLKRATRAAAKQRDNGEAVLTAFYEPECTLARQHEDMLALSDLTHHNGIEIAWVAHFSTAREVDIERSANS